MRKIISVLLLFTFGLSSCEKDDICDPATPTTPRLVIEFFDADNSSANKAVTNLRVTGEGMPESIIFNENATGDAKYRVSGSKIAVPLRTNEKFSTFTFTLDDGNDNAAAINTDQVRFNYSTQNLYVSRACGFKTIFALDPFSDGIPPSNAFIKNDTDNKGFWMRQIFVEEYNIESENETHIKVYF